MLGIKAIKGFALKNNEDKLKSPTRRDLRIKQSGGEYSIYCMVQKPPKERLKKIQALKQQQMRTFVSGNLGSEQGICSAVVVKSRGR